MDKTDKAATPQTRLRRSSIVMVGFPDAHVLDIVGPLEIFSGAKLFSADGLSPYDLRIVAHKEGPLRTSSGLTVQADQSFAMARRSKRPIDTLIIGGGHGVLKARDDTTLLDFVRWAAARARRVVSICTGAMILGELGLLNGKRATTHWWWCPILAREYPQVTVDPDAIYVRDGRVWTSAGVTTGMDMALALVEEDLGHDVALQIAQYNVMYMMRPGGQAQFSTQLIAQKADNPAIGAALTHILEHLTDDLTVTQLAASACMSERSFARKFKDETGMTPAQYVEAARIQAARVALEQSDVAIEQIAIRSGFDQAERMRRAFQRHLGISASEYRERFRPGRTTIPAEPE
ncbi:MAG: GlxA family transcriptional regulator [Burkholderiaceae bacterium]